MVDIVDRETRSRMMAGIRGKNTKPEMMVRSFLHKRGFRFRVHRDDLPGKPDLVLARYRLVIFVHGCFWHRHCGCFYATSPASQKQFWADKLEGNRQRDLRHHAKLVEDNWRVLTVWECGLRHMQDRLSDIPDFIISSEEVKNWPHKPPRTRAPS